MINGNTELIAHIGYPTHAFKAPMIYNPYFDHIGVNARVMPMGCRSEDYPPFLRAVFTLTNIRGALITMPHKVATVALLDRVTPTVNVAGACNAVRRAARRRAGRRPVRWRGLCARRDRARGCSWLGPRALVVGSRGRGLRDCRLARGCRCRRRSPCTTARVEAVDGLAERLRTHYPAIEVRTGSNDPAGFDLVVNATPLGMNAGDPLPLDVSRLEPSTFVGEVVMRTEMTAFLQRRPGPAVARSRSALTCSSSRFPRTWNSSATRPRRPRCCAQSHG
jgi:shikimate dehydrogenase